MTHKEHLARLNTAAQVLVDKGFGDPTGDEDARQLAGDILLAIETAVPCESRAWHASMVGDLANNLATLSKWYEEALAEVERLEAKVAEMEAEPA